jgi:hypothetical protein
MDIMRRQTSLVQDLIRMWFCHCSGQVILLLTINQSVCPSWPQAPNCDSWSYFSLEENFGIVFRGVSTLTGGRGCHVQGSQSYLCYVYVHTHVCMSTITNIIMYKGIYKCQACHSGHCTAAYVYFIYLRHFRHLKDRMPDRHQV